jgi:hypothetical protein
MAWTVRHMARTVRHMARTVRHKSDGHAELDATWQRESQKDQRPRERAARAQVVGHSNPQMIDLECFPYAIPRVYVIPFPVL